VLVELEMAERRVLSLELELELELGAVLVLVPARTSMANFTALRAVKALLQSSRRMQQDKLPQRAAWIAGVMEVRP